MSTRGPSSTDGKQRDLDGNRVDSEGTHLTTNHGVRVSHTDDSLKAGERGPTLMEDFHFREKMTHFDHERIPERVVHARGSGAHGYFQVYESMSKYTRARFLSDPALKTPVFVRFSTVVGFRGSSDTVRDVRGFATKFYTEEGNFDLVANNMPVFFIQDGIKFPDIVHAIKPEPHNEIPQATAAHDNLWDFISLVPETAHQIMWLLSDRAIPRSYRMMEGFGINTFRWVNAEGKGRFIKWHWRPALGTASLVWDEAQKINGADPDFHRRDLWDAIEMGDFPQFELYVQILEEKDEHKFDFDILDATKIWPENEVPLTPIGKMVLNRNPDNFFAETEQVAFHPGHVVPGIDFTNDPLLQGRLFSYIDTQLNRFTSANFNELPINRPLAPVHNNQRDGFMRQTINRGRVNYFPNTIGGGCPMTAGADIGGYKHYMEKVDGRKTIERSEKFKDHFSQAKMFWDSLTPPEQEHLIEAAHYEIGKVMRMEIRERMVHDYFNKIDHDLARRIAEGLGVDPPKKSKGSKSRYKAPEVSVEHQAKKDSIATRKVAILADQGFDYDQLMHVRSVLEERGARPMIVSRLFGNLKSSDGRTINVDRNHIVTKSVLWDAVFVPGGDHVKLLMKQGEALSFITEAYKHYKPVAALGEGVNMLESLRLTGISLAERGGKVVVDKGVVSMRGDNGTTILEKLREFIGRGKDRSEEDFVAHFVAAIAQHRHWHRSVDAIPA